PVDLQLPLGQIDDPVLQDAGSRVRTPLATAVVPEGGVRDLNQQPDLRRTRMVGEMVKLRPRHNDDVRFRLAPAVQDNRRVSPRMMVRAEDGGQETSRAGGGRGMRLVLPHSCDNLPVQQLQSLLGAKETGIRRAVIFLAGPAPRSDAAIGRGRRYAPRTS